MRTLLLLSCMAVASCGAYTLNATTSEYCPEHVHAQIRSYQQQRASTLIMLRGGASIGACYDKYIPQINTVAEQAKVDSQTCISTANEARESELADAREKRKALDNEVQSIQDSLNNCLIETDILKYLECLTNTAESNKAKIDDLKNKAGLLTAAIDTALAAIKVVENSCISTVIDAAKENSNKLFDALQICLLNGGEEPEPEPKPTDEPEPEPTNEPETTVAEPEPEPNLNPVGNNGSNSVDPNEPLLNDKYPEADI